MRKIMFGTHVLVDLDELADKYTKEEIDNMISTVFVYKGTVATTGDLDSIEDPKVGDCWNVEADGNNYAWNGSEWDKLGGTIDLSDYYTKTQVDAIKSALELQIQAVESLPTGGTEGQVLTKNSDTDGDASWKSFNSLVFKEHLDTPDDLPNLGQPSGTLIPSSYEYTNRFNELKLYCNNRTNPGAMDEKLVTAKENYTYYIGIYGDSHGSLWDVIGTEYPEIIRISNINRIVVMATSEKPATRYGNGVTQLLQEKYTIPVTLEEETNWFETNIPSIGIDTSTYNTFEVDKDDGSTYYYNDGMTLLGTSGGTSYTVTDDIPEDLKAYNFYTVGNNNDMYVFNGNTFEVFSKSKVPSGGTTGQVLSKNSDTDNDVIWKTLEASGGNPSDFKTYYMESNYFYAYDDPQSNYYPLDNTDEQAIINILNDAKENEVLPIIFLRQGASYSTLLLPNFDKNMLVNGTLSSYTFYSTLMIGLYQSQKNYASLNSLIEIKVYTVDVKYNKKSSQFTSASYIRGATRLFPVNNTTNYTPTSDYNLSTKKYVDDITGSLESLQTTDKTSLAAAINEIYNINVVTSLWTNSSPTSSLAPGNITLNSSTDDYDSIEFIFTDYIETNNYLSVTVPKGKNVNLSCNLYFAELMHYCSRIITYVNATTYNVKEGYNTSTAYQKPALHNDRCILQEIRGHKVIKSS